MPVDDSMLPTPGPSLLLAVLSVSAACQGSEWLSRFVTICVSSDEGGPESLAVYGSAGAAAETLGEFELERTGAGRRYRGWQCRDR